MNSLLDFYRRTWWLWLIQLIVLIALGRYVSLIFLFGIPLLAAYSVFFGLARIHQLRVDRDKDQPPQK